MFRTTYTATHRPTSLMLQGEEYVSARDATEARLIAENNLIAKSFVFIKFSSITKVGH